MQEQEELLYRIALSMLPGVGPVLARALHQYCGSATQVFREKKSLLAKIPGIGQKRIRGAFSAPVFEQAEKELRFVMKHKVKVLFYTDEAYPKRLNQCPDAPVLLYYKGTASLNEGRLVALVGTRSASPYGVDVTHRLVEGLRDHQVTVVSGLAYGIDICAHEAALKAGLPTIGVTAHGMDRIYPYGHRDTAGRMLQQGGLLTEYHSGTQPDRENFPSRNRIVAGMCDAVVVVEAGDKGGALITAGLAQGYNRDVFAIPGRINDPFSSGCNAFIRENKAALITSAGDLVWMMGWSEERKLQQPAVQTQLFPELSPDEQRVTEVLKEQGECGIDAIAAATAFPFSKLANVLLQLEFKGVLKLKPGRRYTL
ncbi:MAG: DNA-protecting protein DprA [Bacteroidia bacterium]|nr:DNA-protecting protein DprA [Bacteroidia bacterium]